jgi:hypothetical protein
MTVQFASKENIQMARSNQAEDHLELGGKIEKRIFEERQVFNRMAISFLKDYLNGDVKLSDVDQTRFTKEYLKAKISLNQSLDGHLIKTLCSAETN